MLQYSDMEVRYRLCAPSGEPTRSARISWPGQQLIATNPDKQFEKFVRRRVRQGIALTADHPQKQALRDKFLHEHTHDDFEVRFFVEGEGLFYLRVNGRVFAVYCTRGDLISVPAGMTHWFDMGAEPHLKAIRLFTTPEGWVANFTGSDIAERFPRMDDIEAAA